MAQTLTRRSVAFVVVLIAVACGGGAVGEPTPSSVTPTSLEYDHSAGVLIIEADTYGGLMPPPTAKHVAELSIYGDGLVVVGREEEGLSVGTDRVVITGHLSEEELKRLLISIAEGGFFQLEDRYLPSPAAPDMPWRHVTVNLLDTSKTVSIYPFDFADAPEAFWDVYNQVLEIYPSDGTVFTPTSGALTATDLGSVDDLPGGRQSQVAPWDTPLVGIDLAEATEGAHLEGEQYRVVEQYLLRYPPGQLFGSQEGQAYRVLLEADLPWEDIKP
jgi:hypothetical protein